MYRMRRVLSRLPYGGTHSGAGGCSTRCGDVRHSRHPARWRRHTRGDRFRRRLCAQRRVHRSLPGTARCRIPDAAGIAAGAWRFGRSATRLGETRRELVGARESFCQVDHEPGGAGQMAVADASVTFWYGCNMTRHGEIVRLVTQILEAVGVEAAPAGGPGYCCGSPQEANARIAAGMAARTVEK